ncbi:hypothetical protein BofuT4_uP067680.1 [Botrytis cinerea T4]|uniref:Uncharacterized protein n=1 Tax=Botryotinia fuckeliana (strain T4) TaxID=999810 RepID=G2XRJ2_BOTF4|nr:hypothetical protein BofuT4_uP067680.1 [Botrytis cinerea T4]
MCRISQGILKWLSDLVRRNLDLLVAGFGRNWTPYEMGRDVNHQHLNFKSQESRSKIHPPFQETVTVAVRAVLVTWIYNT